MCKVTLLNVKMQIKIKTLTGMKYAYDVDEDTTLDEIKSYILTKTAIQIPQQRYIYCGKLVSDTQRIVELPNATHDMVLNMVLSLRGG